MKIKGHSKIELRDAKTGIITDVREQDNFVTEFPSELFKQMGYLRPNAFANRENNPIDDLFGGIMCFDTAITENADMTGRHPSPLYAPASKNMTANGSIIITDNKAPSELGQYNTNESVASDGFVRRYVYDWDTNEGNGAIGCVCLTSKYGGYIGAGNHTSQTADRSIRAEQPLDSGLNVYYSNSFQSHIITNPGRLAYINWSNNVIGIIQGLDFSSGILVIAEYDSNMVSVNPFKNLDKTMASRKIREVTYNFTPITDTVAKYFTFSQYGHFGIVACSNANFNVSSGIINVLKFNLDNTQEQYRFTNMYPIGYQQAMRFCFLDNYFISSCVACGGGYQGYNILKAIHTGTGVVTDLGTDINTDVGGEGGPLVCLEERVYAFGYVLRVVNGSIIKEPNNALTHLKSYDTNNLGGGQAVDSPYIIYNHSNRDNNWYLCCNGTLMRQYLATISNLQDPVVKTADKTMKITYTLTLLEQN